MGKGKNEGGKNRKKGKHKLGKEEEERELQFKGDGEEYGIVSKRLGGANLQVECIDGVTRLCHIRGTMRNKVWMAEGDLVLINIRGFQTDRGDVVWKYHPNEARKLKQLDHIPDHLKVETRMVDNNGQEEDDTPFDFADL